MNVLVTGGLGYIGSHFITKLPSHMNVILIDNLENSERAVFDKIKDLSSCNLQFFDIDVRDAEKLKELILNSSINVIFHFAGLKSVKESLERENDYYQINVEGTKNLLGSLAANKSKRNFFIFSSSAAVYGNPIKVPISEEHPLNPLNPYGRTKQAAENVLKDFQNKSDNLSVACLRYFNPVGSHKSLKIGDKLNEKMDGLVSNLASSVIKESIFKVYGNDYPTKDGTAIRDFIHIEDLIDGHISAFNFLVKNNNTFDVFNLGTGTGTSILNFIDKFNEVNFTKIKIKFNSRRQGDCIESYADVSKAKTLLRWSTRRSLEEMCKSSWDYQKRIHNL